MSTQGPRATREGLQAWYRQAMARRIEELLGLRGSVEDGDPVACDELRKVAQALRGSGGTFGFPKLSSAAGLVETTADADALRRLEGLLGVLRRLVSEEGARDGSSFDWLQRSAGLTGEEAVGTGATASGLEEAWSVVSRVVGLSDTELAERVARRYGLEVAEPTARSRAAQRLVPEALMTSRGILPLAEDSATITIGTADPTSLGTELEIRRLTGRGVRFAVAPPAAIRTVLDGLFEGPTDRSGREGSDVTLETDTDAADAPTRVLVVDDEESARHLLRSVLEKRGHEVVEASDGLEALRVVRSPSPIGLVVADLAMPRMDGLELIWELRDGNRSADLPVIVVTGERDEVLEAQVMEEGADDYIRKPLDARLLVARVDATLRRARRTARRPSP